MKFLKRFLFTILIIFIFIIGSVFVSVLFYKKEIITLLTTNLKIQYGITLKAEDVRVSFFNNLSTASIQLKNVYLANDLQPNEPLVKANSLFLSFNLKQLFSRQFIVNSISIEDAEINLVKNSEGSKNYEFPRKDSLNKDKSTIQLEISKIRITNTEFKFINKQYNKKIEFTFIDNFIKVTNFVDGVKTEIAGDVFIKGLLFKPEKGPFLSNTLANLNLEASICFPRKEIFVHNPSHVKIYNQQYNLSAFIELKERKRLILNVNAKKVEYQKVVDLLNPGIKKGLSSIKIVKSVDAKALIVVAIGEQQDPIIIMDINSKGNKVIIGKSEIPYSDVSFQASVISLDSTLLKGDADHAKVILKPIKGKVYDFPFTGTMLITSFINPFITINANLFVDVKKINFKPGKEFDLNGSATTLIRYSGPAKNLNNDQFLDAPMNLNAKVKFNNVSYREKNNPHVFYINGNALVTNKTLTFNNLILKMDGGIFSLKGSVDDFVKYTLGRTNGFKAKLKATTDYFDLTSYVVKKADTLAKAKISKQDIKTADSESRFEFDVSLNAKEFLIRKVRAYNATIDLHYKTKLLTLKSLDVYTCEGKLNAKGTIYDLHKIDAEVTTQNINVNKLFEQFENFGQKVIINENLKGNIFLTAKIKMSLDEKMEVIGNTMKGDVKLKLKDGHLLNYEPLQNVSDYIFKNRNFNDIAFTELNETFYIDGFKMDIHEMEIASNVLNLYMSGVYDFKGQSNINLLLPWSNLKKRGKNYIPKNSAQTAENLKGLKLNYSGMPNKLKLSLGNK